MPFAARQGDPTSHGGSLGPAPLPAVSTVLIEGKKAAVVGSVHRCVVPQHRVLGPANVVKPKPGAVTGPMVLIGGLIAARVGDETVCQAKIIMGALTVEIGGLL